MSVSRSRALLVLVALAVPLSSGALAGSAAQHGPDPGRQTPLEREPAGPMHQASGSACTPDWLPIFGPQPGLDSTVWALTIFDDGAGPALYAGGSFTVAGGVLVNHVARWDGVTWSRLETGVNGTVLVLATFDDGTGPALYAGGSFTSAGGVPASRVARWDGTAWSPLGSGVNSNVHALAGFDDGTGPALYAGGVFTVAGGVAASRIARWDGTSWSAVGGGVAGGVGGDVYALEVFDDGTGPALYVGGSFHRGIRSWNGIGFYQPDTGVYGVANPTVRALGIFDDGTGPALYAGGDFAWASGRPANRVARWDGTEWSPLGRGVFGEAYALAAFDDGTGPALYAGGIFQAAGGVAASRIARWDGAHWSSLGSGVNSWVGALVAFDDGGGDALYVGGIFTDSPAGDSYLARWGCPSSPATAFCQGDGSAAPCPCNNENDGSTGSPAGCANANNGGGGVLAAGGSSSIALGDLVLEASNLAPGQPGLFFQADNALNGGQGSPFGDGLRCAGDNVVRLEIRTADADGASRTTIDVAAAGGVAPGDVRRYQSWYRNAGISLCGAGFNLTGGLEITWAP